jgi:hypothetical protein
VAGSIRFANGEVVEVEDASDAEEEELLVTTTPAPDDQLVLSGLEPEGFEEGALTETRQPQTSLRPLYPKPTQQQQQQSGKGQSRAAKALCSCCLM